MVSGFYLRGERVYRRSDSQEIFPVFADILDYLSVPAVTTQRGLPYDCATVVYRIGFKPDDGPITHYRWNTYHCDTWPNSIWLFGSTGECLAYNDYVSLPVRELTLNLRKDLRRLLSRHKTPRCRSLDLRLVWHLEPLTYTEVVLYSPLALLLLRFPDRLPTSSQQWWEQLLLPEFPEDGLREIAPEELREQVTLLEAAYADHMTGEYAPLQWNMDHIRRNLDAYPGPIHAMTLQRRRTEIKRRAGGPAALIGTHRSRIIQIVPRGMPVPLSNSNATNEEPG